MEIRFFQFKVNADPRGKLAYLEAEKDIPFPVKRIYYIFDVASGTTRGFHSHKKLQQCLICINGSVRISLFDGKDEKSVLLNDRTIGLYISNHIWREMSEFSSDAVLLVLASEYFNEADYIRDKNQFLESVKNEY